MSRRPDYCPIGNEPCQNLCETPCGTRKTMTEEQIEAAAKVLAKCMDYPWAEMPTQGQSSCANTLKPSWLPVLVLWGMGGAGRERRNRISAKTGATPQG